ncbi:hypothetical protein J41TS12_36780 [Paenibacillus antibioticophila]|uniref:Uncharacterized protein n=1 Tax=Paenibacillus antibioticophila TaxID=1274374 RepID=A0A920CJE5_9BACL|nr:hypothetical protein [Paenibacillus antibioticophila]GIO38817.1 hypothetical protein J41TS12_36780 [Paenibacillus antibioticophila]
MVKPSEMRLYNQHLWAAPVIPEIDPNEGFYQVQPWQFSDPILELIEQMFIEVEDFFNSRNLPVEVTIYEIKEVFGYLDISSFTPHPEISAIFRRYSELSRKYFA